MLFQTCRKKVGRFLALFSKSSAALWFEGRVWRQVGMDSDPREASCVTLDKPLDFFRLQFPHWDTDKNVPLTRLGKGEKGISSVCNTLGKYHAQAICSFTLT